MPSPQIDPRGQQFAAAITSVVLVVVLLTAPGLLGIALLAAQAGEQGVAHRGRIGVEEAVLGEHDRAEAAGPAGSSADSGRSQAVTSRAPPAIISRNGRKDGAWRRAGARREATPSRPP